MNLMKKNLFGTSGIRGDAEKLFTNQFCFDLGRTFAIFLKIHKANNWIAIGNDPRDSSPRIKKFVILGMLYENREVYDEGTTSIPSINYILKAEPNFSGSIMVTGSHIKADLNGLKFFAFGEEILKQHEAEIQKIYYEEENKVDVKYVKIKEAPHIEDKARSSYIDYLTSSAHAPYPKWKIVVDPGNGAQSETMPEVLRMLEQNVISMNVDIQNNFLSRDTEVEGDFADLQRKVREEKADMGVGYDSDGDRVIFVDENGEFIPGDYSGALIAQHLDSKRVVTTINTSQVIDKIGLEVIRTKVGSPYVVEALKKNNIPFGFESNGGGIFPEMRSRDGGRSTIEFLNLLKASNKSVSELVAELPKFYISREKIEYKWELKDEILKKAKEEFKGIKIEELDGLKIWIDDSTWILFRSSMNAPEFRVFVESLDTQKSKKLLKDGIDFVKDIIKHA
jgi:phosphomannomutase / phosphoglucomutase